MDALTEVDLFAMYQDWLLDSVREADYNTGTRRSLQELNDEVWLDRREADREFISLLMHIEKNEEGNWAVRPFVPSPTPAPASEQTGVAGGEDSSNNPYIWFEALEVEESEQFDLFSHGKRRNRHREGANKRRIPEEDNKEAKRRRAEILRRRLYLSCEHHRLRISRCLTTRHL